ncbi:MAG: helix-turn-helix transcriptional regulator [Bacteroidaceae bacterium]|nr:helix-turn-helix transcriptional regulator [Bacteroidaceae bacterium]
MAIIDSNMLACMGLQYLLRKLIPIAEVQIFASYDEFMADDPESFAHHFVSSRIYFEHTQTFRQRPYRTIVLVNGENIPHMPGVLTLNIARSEQELTTDILQLHSHGHGNGPHRPRQAAEGHPHGAAHPHSGAHAHGHHKAADPQPLTPREIDVLKLLGKGYINKEIGDRLNISLTTVITHRKNIMTKLGAHSLSDVIIYAVMNGYIDLGE